MKKYYQYKGLSSYKLKHSIYRATYNKIKTYPDLLNIVKSIEEKDEINLKPEDIEIKTTALYEISIIEAALSKWVYKEYQEAILKHIAYSYKYSDLSDKYYISEQCMKKWTQIFVFGVAKEFGTDYVRDNIKK